MRRNQIPNLFQRSFATARGAWVRIKRTPRNVSCEPLVPAQAGFRLVAATVLVMIPLLMAKVDEILVLWVREVLEDNPQMLAGFDTITHFGTSAWILIISGVTGLVLSTTDWKSQPRRKRLAGIDLYADANFVFFTVAIAGTTASLIKNTIGRARPKLMNELGPYHFEFGAFDAAYASFPSGHSTTSGAVCMAMTLLLPRWWLLWLVLGVLGGISRVAVGAHYPSDVLAGLSFGALFALLAARWLAQRDIMFALDGGSLPRRRRLLYSVGVAEVAESAGPSK